MRSDPHRNRGVLRSRPQRNVLAPPDDLCSKAVVVLPACRRRIIGANRQTLPQDRPIIKRGGHFVRYTVFDITRLRGAGMGAWPFVFRQGDG
jgi:hypothetical protein